MENRRNLIIFGSGSLLAHGLIAALLLIAIQDTNLITTSQQSTDPVLQVSLLSQTAPKKAQQKSPAVDTRTSTASSKPATSIVQVSESRTSPDTALHQRPSLKASNSIEVNSDSREQSVEKLTEPVLSTASENQGKDTSSDKSTISSRNTMIQEKLHALITLHKKYPRFAVRRGWQGTVKLGLRVEADGKLSNLRVLKTSGYRILDEAALTMLTSASNLSGVQDWLNGHYFDTTLPVEYRLTGG